MFLKSLELTGFKSFAKRTVLKFEPGITAIVGPNGSGKSNIADAIRWVLGAQSKKAVRGKVSTDVIFSGTAQRPAMSLAEVSLMFDNQSHALPFDFDEVVVTRRLYRSGDSEYLINGSKVRLLDLQHAFAVAGVGAENYTVISQGLVDQVLTQSPRDRRALFEEAAGVRQFFIKRDEARRKLTETETNLNRVEDVLKELAPRLKMLRRQANALAKRAEVEQQLTDARLAYYGRRYRELAGQHRDAKAKQDEVNREFLTIGKELKELTGAIDQRRKSQQGLTLNKLLAERNKVRDRRDELQERQNRLVIDREVGKTKLENLTRQRRQTGQVVVPPDQLTKALDELDQAVGRLGSEIESGKAKPDLLKGVSNLKRLIEKTRQLGTAPASGQPDLGKEESTAKQTIAEAESALRQLEATRKEVDDSLEQLDAKIAAEQQRSFGDSEELSKQEKALRDKQRAHDAYRTELSELNLELARLETRLEDLIKEAKPKLAPGAPAPDQVVVFPPQDGQPLPDVEASEEAIAKLEQKLLEMGGIDPEVTAEHKEVEERYTFLSGQAEDLKKAKTDLDKVIRELEKKSRTLFTESFEKINAEFGTHFEKLFGGGRAELRLVKLSTEEDEEESADDRVTDYGIEIRAVPPGKRLKSLAQLSGGERALTSNALLFAILAVNPSPFVMLDEVDAALDEANTGRFAAVLRELAERTQFLVVTHNRDTMKAASMLYGVSMDSSGVSTMLSLKLPEAEKAVAKAA